MYSRTHNKLFPWNGHDLNIEETDAVSDRFSIKFGVDEQAAYLMATLTTSKGS